MKIRNISRQALYVPALGRVIDADQVFEVADKDAEGFLCQPNTWAAESAPVKKSQEG
jgi:hypothetical protein